MDVTPVLTALFTLHYLQDKAKMSSASVSEQVSTVEKSSSQIVHMKDKTKLSGMDMLWVLTF